MTAPQRRYRSHEKAIPVYSIILMGILPLARFHVGEDLGLLINTEMNCQSVSIFLFPAYRPCDNLPHLKSIHHVVNMYRVLFST
jgi:hypothetical protein